MKSLLSMKFQKEFFEKVLLLLGVVLYFFIGGYFCFVKQFD